MLTDSFGYGIITANTTALKFFYIGKRRYKNGQVVNNPRAYDGIIG